MTVAQSTLSPVLSWAQTQQAAISKDGTEKQNALREMSEVFMTMLQSASSNPLSQNDPAEGMRLIQGLVEAHSRIEEGERLKTMESALLQNNLLQASSLVGKRGQFQGNHFQVGDSKDDIAYDISKDLALKEVEISIHRADGFKIATLKGDTTAGLHSLNDKLHEMPKGRYSLHIKGTDMEGNEVPIESLITSKLDHLKFKDNRIYAGSGSNMQPVDQLKALYESDYSLLDNALSMRNL